MVTTSCSFGIDVDKDVFFTTMHSNRVGSFLPYILKSLQSALRNYDVRNLMCRRKSSLDVQEDFLIRTLIKKLLTKYQFS